MSDYDCAFLVFAPLRQRREDNSFDGNDNIGAKVIADRHNLRVVHSFTLETPWSHLRSIVAERATVDDDAAIHAICFSPTLAAARADHALSLFSRNWSPDRWIGEREIDGPSPAPFLSGYMPDDTLRKIARKMRLQRHTGSIAPRRRHE